jgi:tRNA A-37 threonylcarbamoyl transferase component Bud32/TolB-like protein
MPADISFTGKMLGRFRVHEKVGEGGMGVVYRAEDTRLNREVALKLIHPNHVQDPEARKRFLREAQAASALTHPNVCTIHSIEEEQGQLFLVLEFLEGRTLKEQAAELRRDVKELLEVLVQGAEGLAEAHRRNVVHRDIKPSNLLTTSRGLVKIMDFGLAKQVAPLRQQLDANTSDGVAADLTNPGVTIGTTHYMSPEQARGREVDVRSDVFSYGVVMYEMASGKLPFIGQTTVDVLDQILNAEPPPPSSMAAALGPDFDRIVNKCLRKDAAERYPSAADLAVDLKQLRRDLDSGPRPAAGSTAMHPVAAPRSHWRSALLVLAGLAVLVGGTVGAILLTHQKQDTTSSTAAAGRPAVAVVAFENRTGDAKYAWYGSNAAELLAVDLARLANVDIISKQRIYEVLQEMRTKDGMPPMEAGVATEVARKVKAGILVRGDTLLLGGKIILKAEVMDVVSGRLMAAERVTDVTEQNVLAKLDELGSLLREKLKTVK